MMASLLKRLVGSAESSSSAPVAEAVASQAWFQFTTGLVESDFRQPENLKKGFRTREDGAVEIVNHVRGTTYSCGKYTESTIADLRKAIPAHHSLFPTDTSKFVPITFLCADSNARHYVSVTTLQSDPNYRNSVFQVASNFNGVEAIGPDADPEEPTFVTDYIYDNTQGPKASMSAAAAAIQRVLAYYRSDDVDPRQWGLSMTRQPNYLQNLAKYITVSNGYAVLTGKEEDVPAHESKEYHHLVEQVRVGIHRDVEVVFGSHLEHAKATYTPDGIVEGTHGMNMQIVNESKQQIDQVFCAAINRSQGRSGMTNALRDHTGIKTQLCLDAAYEGTYLAAVTGERQTVVLTLIGGGVFGNHKDAIMRAIVRAHKKYAHGGTSIKSAQVVLYSDDPRGLAMKVLEHDIPAVIKKFEPLGAFITEDLVPTVTA